MSALHTAGPVRTPFGRVTLDLLAGGGLSVALLRDTCDPRAELYAAKSLGVERVVELVAARSIDRLLPRVAVVVPDDLVDLTIGRPATFFVDRGYGFIGQQPAFCSELRRAAIETLSQTATAWFSRGTLAVLDELDAPFDARWSAQLASRSGAPAVFLAKELELCYLPLALIGPRPDLSEVLTAMLHRLPVARGCACAVAMRPARERGSVGDDWRSWL